MTETTETETEIDTETVTDETDQVDPVDTEGNDPVDTDDEQFPASYVRELRQEAKDHRVAAKDNADRADQLAHRLHAALVSATGRLADPDDLPFDADHLDDPDKLTEAVDDLLARKPHLASRRPSGSIGQGETGGNGSVDLASMLRARA